MRRGGAGQGLEEAVVVVVGEGKGEPVMRVSRRAHVHVHGVRPAVQCVP